MEVSEVRRRLRTAMDDARRRADERRAAKDAQSRAWEKTLQDVVVPAFHLLASALNAEGYRFKVVTPGATARLVPERGGEEFIEVALDSEADEPAVMIRSTRGRGRRTVARERAIATRSAIEALTDTTVTDEVIAELEPFLHN